MLHRICKAITLLAVATAMPLSGCAVVSVVDAGVSVAATLISTTVSVAGTAVSTTAKVGGAVIDAVIPESKNDRDGKK